MIILGLTGSIGMGKSTTANDLRSFGIPVHDADAVVRDLLCSDKNVVAATKKVFPYAVRGNTINRKILGDQVFKDLNSLLCLEAIIHPKVHAEESAFLKRCTRQRIPIVVLDIPLLYETKSERRCDAVIVTTAPTWLQRARVLARSDMTETRFLAILKRQISNTEKCRRADFLVQTGLGRSYARRMVFRIISEIRTMQSLQ